MKSSLPPIVEYKNGIDLLNIFLQFVLQPNVIKLFLLNRPLLNFWHYPTRKLYFLQQKYQCKLRLIWPTTLKPITLNLHSLAKKWEELFILLHILCQFSIQKSNFEGSLFWINFCIFLRIVGTFGMSLNIFLSP